MALIDTIPVGPDTAQWPVWSTTARLVVTDPATLRDAEAIVREELAAVEAACSRVRDDSELSVLQRAGGGPARVSPLLAELVQAALVAAKRTDGDVDPTVGGVLADLGYDRDIELLARQSVDGRRRPMRLIVTPAPDWRRVRLDSDTLTVPRGMRLDLGAPAKAFTADRCARRV